MRPYTVVWLLLQLQASARLRPPASPFITRKSGVRHGNLTEQSTSFSSGCAGKWLSLSISLEMVKIRLRSQMLKVRFGVVEFRARMREAFCEAGVP